RLSQEVVAGRGWPGLLAVVLDHLSNRIERSFRMLDDGGQSVDLACHLRGTFPIWFVDQVVVQDCPGISENRTRLDLALQSLQIVVTCPAVRISKRNDKLNSHVPELVRLFFSKFVNLLMHQEVPSDHSFQARQVAPEIGNNSGTREIRDVGQRILVALSAKF